jgi:hypothetical protein
MPKAIKSQQRSATGRAGLVGRARTEAESLVRDARRVGAQVQQSAEKIVADFERRAERIMSRLEVRAAKAVEPALKRTFATRRELRAIRVAVRELAAKVDDLARRFD